VQQFGLVSDDLDTEEDETRLFVESIADVRFSAPELVWAGKIEENTTVEAIEKANGLKVQYSTELTKDEIAAISRAEIKAVDWALISLKAFDTEEALTITMADGKTYEIRTTDGQIRKTYLSDSGETWEIVLTYGDEAGIPDDADVQVEEIIEGTEYEDCLRDSAEKLGVDSAGVGFARFFDITIVKDGAKVTPQAPVQVTITLTDTPADMDTEALKVVHFGEELETIDAAQAVQTGEESVEVVFDAEGFSVYGVITVPTAPTVTNLDGRTFTINRGGRYVMTGTTDIGDGGNHAVGFGKGSKSEAPVWQFEQVEGSTYYIFTMVDNQKKYVYCYSGSNSYISSGCPPS